MILPADPKPFSRLVERGAGAGFNLIELAEDEDAALRDDWGDDQAAVRIQPGRVGLVSAAGNHYPQVQVSSYTSEPPAVKSTRKFVMETLGTWPVVFKSRQVQVWSGDSYPGDELPIELPKSKGGRYLLRVAVGYRDIGGIDLEEHVDQYYAAHGNAPVGAERFVVDFWPA